MKAIRTPSGADVEILVRRHQGAVRGYLLFLGCPAAQVDDFVQETFLSFLSAAFQDRGEASTRAYLRTVARNHFLKSLRREGARPPMTDLEDAEEAWVDFESDDGGDRWRDALDRCVQALQERAQSALRLRYGRSLSRTAIAGELGISSSGVKSILVRARQQLRKCVERRLAT